jgi:hypothetical protein
MPPPSASSGGHWRRTQVAGKNTAYSTPSIAVQGRNHSLWYFSRTSGRWHGQQPLDSGFVTLAPSLVTGTKIAGAGSTFGG